MASTGATAAASLMTYVPPNAHLARRLLDLLEKAALRQATLDGFAAWRAWSAARAAEREGGAS